MTAKEQEDIFNHWLQAHKGTMFKIVRAWSSSITEADDLFQEIAIRVWKSVSSFRGESSVNTWIYRIALNTAISWKAHETRHARLQKENNISLVLEQPNLIQDERLTWLYAAIHQLEPVDRSIALLLLDGYSYKEMATLLGISTDNVGIRIHRIKKALSVFIKNK